MTGTLQTLLTTNVPHMVQREQVKKKSAVDAIQFDLKPLLDGVEFAFIIRSIDRPVDVIPHDSRIFVRIPIEADRQIGFATASKKLIVETNIGYAQADSPCADPSGSPSNRVIRNDRPNLARIVNVPHASESTHPDPPGNRSLRLAITAVPVLSHPNPRVVPVHSAA